VADRKLGGAAGLQKVGLGILKNYDKGTCRLASQHNIEKKTLGERATHVRCRELTTSESPGGHAYIRSEKMIRDTSPQDWGKTKYTNAGRVAERGEKAGRDLGGKKKVRGSIRVLDGTRRQ